MPDVILRGTKWIVLNGLPPRSSNKGKWSDERATGQVTPGFSSLNALVALRESETRFRAMSHALRIMMMSGCRVELRFQSVVDTNDVTRRVKFYGENDLATGLHVERVGEVVREFDPARNPSTVEDALELHNVQQYLEHGFLPGSYTEDDRNRAQARIPEIRGAVARFFSTLDDSNLAPAVSRVGHEYHKDLLALLGQNGIFDRFDSKTVLPALRAAGVNLRELLASRKLVKAYDAEMREELQSSVRGAEHLIRKYLQDDVGDEVNLPVSFTSVDAKKLLEAYVDSDEANPNYVGLLATAKENPHAGIDAKLKLRARRRKDALTAKLFTETVGLKTGFEVGFSETQEEPVVFETDTSDGYTCRWTYSSRWLEETCDNPSILNNFVHLFEFVDQQMVLALPAYPAHLGVMEQLMGATGKTEYKVGVAFHATDTSSALQTRLYQHFLESRDIDLEQVFSWFFETYLVEEFGAMNFSFTPSGRATPYLQRVRHLFAEMESIANQFTLFARDDELDRDLLAMETAQTRYKEIRSLLDGKYLYPSEAGEISGILRALFSDQSTLRYIDETTQADTAAALLLERRVEYENFHDYQKPSIDQLIELGVLVNTGECVQFANAEQLRILNALFTTQAVSYFHLSSDGRAAADDMVARGWAKRGSSLLTVDEANYFNYFLNAVDFSNGPQLRNKYLHGSQANQEGDDAHFNTYIIALRLTVALIIKMNDDFCLWASLNGKD